jgi:hypothetical protein
VLKEEINERKRLDNTSDGWMYFVGIFPSLPCRFRYYVPHPYLLMCIRMNRFRGEPPIVCVACGFSAVDESMNDRCPYLHVYSQSYSLA